MARYDNIDKIKDENITRIGTSYLPKVKEQNSDVLLIATEGDRCDHLAQEYYGDVNLWWYIASVNNLNFNRTSYIKIKWTYLKEFLVVTYRKRFVTI